ncbi:putative GPI-anchored protein pfl2 [Brassica napus]|uniref:putative GPI-anchored protein pfl2 n=1 Tax=Brassica napus TaxID=3708 RepID=UPI00207ADD84|nr:putative GPI-anchored protein pfl2 [Brassica napus]
MNPSARNLYKTTSPTYLEDGTPMVTIPSKLLLHGPENQKEYIIGQFHRCSIPSDVSTRSWILQRGLWHLDDCLMFVAPWSPAASLSLPEISTIPVWVTLKNIPSRLYSNPGISRIASALGAPMLTNKPRLDPTLMGETKILVEVELDKQFPQKIALNDKRGTISLVDVEYSWIPTKCGKCGHLGHKDSRCLQKSAQPRNSSHPSNDQIGASLASASVYPSVLVPEVATDDMSIYASVTVARTDSAIIPTVSPPVAAVASVTRTPVAAVASITGTPVVSAASVTEHVPTLMAPSPTVNIGSVHVPSTSVSTTVIQAIEALPTTSVATLKSTSVSDGQVLASSPSSFFEILPTTNESEPSTPATIFKATTTATATPSSNSALSENAPLNTDHTTTLEDLPATGSVFFNAPTRSFK